MYLVLIYAYHLDLFGMQYENLNNIYHTKNTEVFIKVNMYLLLLTK